MHYVKNFFTVCFVDMREVLCCVEFLMTVQHVVYHIYYLPVVLKIKGG